MQKTLVAIVGLLILTSVGCTVLDPEYCSSSMDCAQIVMGATGQSYGCHPTNHVCIPVDADTCFKEEDCRDVNRPHCNKSLHCEPCVLGDASDVSCGHLSATPFCGSAPQAAGSTQTVSRCVACRTNMDCPSTTPICDNQSCRKCNKHTDCEGMLYCDSGALCTDSLVCIGDTEFGPDKAGTCAQNGPGTNGRVVYVHSGPECSDVSGHSGTDVNSPFCTLNAAYLTAADQLRRYIRVLASGQYDPLMYVPAAGAFSFIGSPVPSRGLNKPATVVGRGASALGVSDNGDLTVDEFDLFELQAGGTLVGCQGDVLRQKVPTFTLRNSILRGSTMQTDTSGGAAVDLSNCQAKIYGNIIGLTSASQLTETPAPMAHLIGLSVSAKATLGTNFDISNNIIAGNWGMAVDLYNVGNTNLTFRFNTVVNNGRAGGFGGITCSSTSSTQLGYSIVVNNTPSGGSQFGSPGGCRFKQMVVPPSDTNSDLQLIKMSPSLDDSWFLTAQGNGCCIDQAQPMAGETFPSIDIRRTARPQGSGWDLGAFELVK